ncbi:RNA polymerase sigma factor SigJ [Nocardioides sp.]|uniref:RNA polymerase sigma factor SigJ n=1 Tax=Nocardioides sp. TaxID=35761 RepID=UPI00351492F4
MSRTGAGARDVELAEAYARVRPRLERVAYAILGSLAEAEDVVAETWLRLVAADAREPVRDVGGWATVAVSRGALDVLGSARVRREAYVGPWLPEPSVAGTAGSPVGDPPGDPADRVTLDDDVRYALLVALERLSPAERTSWVLHDLFAVPFDEVAAAVGRSPEAVRQLASRARRHVRAEAPRLEVSRDEHDEVVQAFLAAAGTGDLAALVAVLDPAVVATSDGGGVVSAARRPVEGADRVARFLLGVTARALGHPGADLALVQVNGRLGLLLLRDRAPDAVVSLTVAHGRVQRVDLVRAPDKLTRVRAG